MQLAPIVLFVYNRPEHTRRTLEALATNYLAGDSHLIVFADGSKVGATLEEKEKIEQTRKVVKSRNWCKTVEIFESENNNGLAQSVINGVTKVVNVYGRVIVLEDDLITSPWFLTFMNDGLEMYQEIQNVYSINGYMFPFETERLDAVLLPYTSTWGWATWKDRWSVFEITPEENKILSENIFLKQRFDLADYDFTSMLINAKQSWGIHWYFSIFRRNGLGVFPTQSLVTNEGFDGSGVHCSDTEINQIINRKRIEVTFTQTIDLNFYSNYINYFISCSDERLTSSFLKKTIRKIYAKANSKLFKKKID